jgi:hypothetical protein
MLITDQVATAPYTDYVQAQYPTFKAKSFRSFAGSWGLRPRLYAVGVSV